MKIIFDDLSTLQVQIVENKGDYLRIKTISASPDQLRTIFEDQIRTKRMIVEERGRQTTYEGFTTYHHSEEYPGKIYGVVMYKPERTPEVQVEVQAAAITVAQIQAQALTDEQAFGVQAIYPAWSGDGVAYTVDYKVLYNGTLYKCLQNHTSQTDWTPEVSPSLFVKVLIQDPETIPEWEQPDANNAYMTGDKVTHDDKIWASLVDDNVWEPGATGTESLWKEVE